MGYREVVGIGSPPAHHGTAKNQVSLRETHWGFVIHQDRGVLHADMVAESSLKFLGLTIMLAAGVQWLYPALMHPVEALAVKILLMIGFMIVGVATYLHAHKGFQREIQIDTTKREARVVTKNSRGSAFVRETIRFRDIESCFLRRLEGKRDSAKLYFRLRSKSRYLAAATGETQELTPVLQRLAAELRPKTRRVTGKQVSQAA